MKEKYYMLVDGVGLEGEAIQIEVRGQVI